MPRGDERWARAVRRASARRAVGAQLAEDRRKNPTNDLTSALVHNEVGEDMLDPSEIAPFFILLAWLWKRQSDARIGETVERLPRLVSWLNPAALLAIYLSWSLFNLLIYHTRTF